ncbi:MAG TPA: hypothetical protein VJY62_00015 [Bacteroidia bacterium]|nr:hypothetical protein [Bacteroidia bacterium]
MPQTFRNIVENNIKKIAFGGYLFIAFLCHPYLMEAGKAEPKKVVPKFKYEADHKAHAPVDCPPNEASSLKRTAFRYVNNPITTDNFKTYIQLGWNPKATDPAHKICKACGLSMYSTKDKAYKKYRGNPNKSNVKYTHIAEGVIESTDGIYAKPRSDGHFTLHEFEGVTLINKFKVVAELK